MEYQYRNFDTNADVDNRSGINLVFQYCKPQNFFGGKLKFPYFVRGDPYHIRQKFAQKRFRRKFCSFPILFISKLSK